MALFISFLSDFGLRDEFVGVVHGVIARIAPEVRVIDVGHGFPAGDIRAGALGLLRAIQYLPPGVALAVVDPGVGTGRRALAAETEWGFFVGPDNGLLAPAVAMVGGANHVVAIENPELRLPAEGDTFHGRDLFAPAAAVLAAGQAEIGDLGPEIEPGSITPLMLPLVEHGADRVTGEVLWVDRFGNAQTNIAPADLELIGLARGSEVVVTTGGSRHPMLWVDAYGEAEPGHALLHVDSYGQIAVAVRDGSARESLAIEAGMAVTVHPIGSGEVEVQGIASAR